MPGNPESRKALLSDEILEDIFSLVERHADLVNLACVCRSFSVSIIPRQTEYRIIRTGQPIPFVWAHLARRQDLAKNIRTISFSFHRSRYPPSRIPTTLVDNVDKRPENRDPFTSAKNMCKALRSMFCLKEFIWEYTPESIVAPLCQRMVVLELAQTSSLEVLKLFTSPAVTVASQHQSQEHVREEEIQIFCLDNLKQLGLGGSGWSEPSQSYLLRLLQSSTIQSLDLPGEFARDNLLASINIPSLTTFKINSALSHGVNPAICHFLKNNPSIQTLHWVCSGEITLEPESLPELRHVIGHIEVVRALEALYQGSQLGDSPLPKWNIVQLDVSMTISELNTFTCFDGSALSGFRALGFAAVWDLLRMAELFPNIEWLSLPSTNNGNPLMNGLLGEWHNVLSNFPKLKRFHDIVAQLKLEFDSPVLAELVFHLARISPTLETITGQFCNLESRYLTTIRIRRERLAEGWIPPEINPRGEVISRNERIFYEIEGNQTTRYISKQPIPLS